MMKDKVLFFYQQVISGSNRILYTRQMRDENFLSVLQKIWASIGLDKIGL